ncbi:hypothetical protein F183_A43900 [Bryobacterales bacterium F-183]|nr:hypothetical protein F183_A43900 [Bryobacterales bacterium F-183]
MLQKLRPDQDLQCFFFRPSAIAALSDCGPNKFTVSGSWRQQFDWAVVEWNRDNVFEHPALRNLPDGDLRGLTITYEETRENCIPLDSDLFPTVDWPNLRVFTRSGTQEVTYFVPLKDHAEPIEGVYSPATAEVELQGTITQDDYVGFRFLGEHHTFQCYFDSTLTSVANALVDSVNTFSLWCKAERIGTSRIRLTYLGNTGGIRNPEVGNTVGANGNRISLYTYVSGAATESWNADVVQFGGGTSPSKWRVSLELSNLLDDNGMLVPVSNVRKLRWTWAADFQVGEFMRSEFAVHVTNWVVTGADRTYHVAGPGSARYEDDAREVTKLDTWFTEKGNYSGGSIAYCRDYNAAVRCTYRASATHTLYLGTLLTPRGPLIDILVDGVLVVQDDLFIPGENMLARRLIGEFSAGVHNVEVRHRGTDTSDLLLKQYFYFDFFDVVVPTPDLPTFPVEPKITLASDWDTDHSLPLAPERTAWLVHKLGFHGRHNLYVGALIFYELYRKNHVYASKTITFSGVPVVNAITSLSLVRDDYPIDTTITLNHLNIVSDTPEKIATAFALELNRGYTGLRAEATGNTLKIISRTMGADGNHWMVTGSAVGTMSLIFSGIGSHFEGGVDGDWRSDLAASPKINRACRDWCRSFMIALRDYGIDTTAAFSTEMKDGDPDEDAGIAQRYPDGSPVLLNTPAIQGNFSPTSIAFWREVYKEFADIMAEVGIVPYLQFGEVQWWYFPKAGVGMTFYDTYTKQQFEAEYGRPMAVIMSNYDDPAAYPDEVEFLPKLIGAYTDAIMEYVRLSHPSAKFEVLYPTDVNDGALNQRINYAWDSWTPAKLDNLKTESFTYTGNRRLDLSLHRSCDFGFDLGFLPTQRSHLVGISDPYTGWLKEVRYAEGRNQDSVVLWALDQFCLVGFPMPLEKNASRSYFSLR